MDTGIYLSRDGTGMFPKHPNLQILKILKILRSQNLKIKLPSAGSSIKVAMKIPMI